MSAAAEPLISVALCTYNGERYLRQQLDSLLAQTYSNLEIVAVDDGSTDRTVELLREYEQRDPRLRVAVNPRNLGFIRNFERTLVLAKGAFIAPCDQDDIWLPDKLRILASRIGNHAMAYCDSELIDADGRSLGMSMSRFWAMQDLNDPAALIVTNCVSGHAMLFRRELLGEAPQLPAEIFHDWWLAMWAAANGGVVYCPEKLVRYRQHGKNVTDVLRAHRKRARRIPGSRMKSFDDTAWRLRYLSTLRQPQGEFFGELHKLWLRSETAWFAPSLATFILHHRGRLYRLLRKGPVSLVRKSMSHIFGLRLRRLFKPAKYARIVAST
ncbi:glycosyltransferase family 2 protein [Steroidobacter sp.]|uniref:glycosyltransferase family 2 protein n=1 Tax=Steroidobacter sp. TaxID=1978227 RepID=UPI001A567D01|nr:glycosyltransferase family 2 protein [Steroidobacter sp.]MBL8270713.1 glycosyltransferase family 2 protein [Steroidobacter sp.]